MQPSTIARRALGVLVTAAVAAASFAALPAQAADATTSVAGRVTLDGKPTAGLKVCAGGAIYTEPQGYQYYDACTTTDAAGAYLVSFEFPGSTNMAAVWVDPGTQYQGVFPWTAVNQIRDLGGYIDLAQGDRLTGMDIALASYPKRLSVAQPVIAGKAKVGKQLSATVSITGADTATVSYRWYRNGHKIAGATKKTYRLTKHDLRKRISVAVTVRVPGVDPVTVTSARTAKITRR